MNKELQKLKKLWDKKLKASGFIDIEEQGYSDPLLIDWDSHYYKCRYTKETFESKQYYYQQASLFLESYEFESNREKKIWSMHSEGLPLREIAKKIRTTLYQVHKTVRQTSKIMLSSCLRK